MLIQADLKHRDPNLFEAEVLQGQGKYNEFKDYVQWCQF